MDISYGTIPLWLLSRLRRADPYSNHQIALWHYFGNRTNRGHRQWTCPCWSAVRRPFELFFHWKVFKKVHSTIFRMNMLIINVFCFTVGCLIYIQSFPVLIFCRFCQGIGMGIFTSVAPLIIR